MATIPEQNLHRLSARIVSSPLAQHTLVRRIIPQPVQNQAARYAGQPGGQMRPRILEQSHPEYYAAGGVFLGGLLGYFLGRRSGHPVAGAAAGGLALGAGAYVVAV